MFESEKRRNTEIRMQSSCKDGTKDGTKEPVGVFTVLRRLGREVDEGIKNAQTQLNGHRLDCETNRHMALKGLLDRRKELGTLKPQSRSMVNELRARGKKFEQSLQACSEVIDDQLQQLLSLQTHLTQYGFVPQPEGDEDTEEGDQETEPEEVERPNTPPQDSEGKAEVEKTARLTPRLEDFGVSSYTLNMLKRPAQPVPERLQMKKEAPRHDSVPDMFHNEGLTVTPSLFSSQPYGTGNRFAVGAYSLPYSPDPEPQDLREVDPDLADTARQVAKTLDFSDSPVPPVLHTPGIKQIPRTGQVLPPPPQGQRGPVARQLKLGEGAPVREYDTLDSPIPPMLSMPGIQQINTRFTAPQPAGHTCQASVGGGYSLLEMPKTPEFTYSLRDLEDITVSFRQTELSSTFGERSATTSNSDLDMSASTQPSAQDGRGPSLQPSVSWSKMHATGHHPVVPDRLKSDQMMAGLAVSEPQLSSWSRGGVDAESLDLPPTPELTMCYSTRPRPAAAVSSLPSSGFLSHQQTRWGRLESEENMGQAGERYGGERPHLSTSGLSVNQSEQVFYHKEQCEKRRDLPHKSSAFVSVHSSHSGSSGAADTRSGVLRSRENILPTVQSEVRGKADPMVKADSFVNAGFVVKAGSVVKDAALPDQPVLRHPLTEGGLDMPATPKFFGSYHFMGSKR